MEKNKNSGDGKERSFYISIRIKMLLVFTLLFVIVFGATFYWFYQFATALAMDNVEDELTAIAATIAEEIDGDLHQELYESDIPASASGEVEDERYWEIVDFLGLVQRAKGTVITLDGTEIFRVFPYTYVPTEEEGVVEFVTSVGALNDPPSGAGFREEYTPQSQQMLDGFDQVTVNIDNPIRDPWGIWVSGFAPFYNSEGEVVGAVGVDMLDTTVISIQNRIKQAVLPVMIVTVLALFASVYLISYGISRPVIQLTRSAQRVAEGDYSEGVIPPVQGWLHDETTTLTKVFDSMVDKVRAREQRLRERVAQLEVIIDEGKRKRQVDEITESEFFQDLRAKARVMRAQVREEGKEEEGKEEESAE